ncbi:hypothetical protein ACNTMW_30855 [Planosporangium sp. 12N6]|uniref:hypothetical protein n=1 Tax=Planosporangium spinosum TaxID=3402278 RepID=UPI003CFBC2CD
MINPGARPVDNATEAAAAANIKVFVVAVMEQGGQLAGDPIRDPEADRGRQVRLPVAGRQQHHDPGAHGWGRTAARARRPVHERALPVGR